MTEKSEKLEFENGRGAMLAARLERPAGEPIATALFAHCFTCSKDVAAASRISRGLRARGFAVLRFDFTGLGNSEGDFANTNFSSNLDDLVAAAAALGERVAPPALLVGHSLGGAAVLAAADRIEGVRAVATIGAPSRPQHVEHLFADRKDTIESEGSAEVELAGRRFRIEKQFIDDLDTHDILGRLASLDGALLFLHSPIDEVVALEHARELYMAAKHPKSFISLDGADHLLSDPEDSAYVAEVLAAWAGRYVVERGETAGSPMGRTSAVASPAVPPARTDRPLADGVVRVSPAGGKFTHSVRAGEHAWLADEPTAVGGDDRGPNPYDFLLAALGTCTAMTLSMYAERKGWSFEGATVDLSHDRIHARDCEECTSKEGRVDRITRSIELHGSLDPEQRARLLEIADRCPVHRTLVGEKTIPTAEVSSDGEVRSALEG